jgi:hypothetical protein
MELADRGDGGHRMDVEKRGFGGSVWFSAFIAGLVLSGCGGIAITEAGDGGAPPAGSTMPGASGGPDEEGGAAPFPVCPAQPPSSGASCEMAADQGCSYREFLAGAWSCSAFVCLHGKWAEASGGC